MHTDLTFLTTIKRLARLVALFLGCGVGFAAEKTPTVLFLGDSLTAGYGLETEQAYPALVEQQLLAEGLEVTVINGGLSGETTAGGLRRLRWVMQRPVDILVLALGANDGLRGLSVPAIEQNLRNIVQSARELQPGIQILLCGMYAPPNMGADYRAAFDEIYPRLADELSLTLLPFILENVAGVRALNQADGIHPNRDGQAVIAKNVLSTLRPLLGQASRPSK